MPRHHTPGHLHSGREAFSTAAVGCIIVLWLVAQGRLAQTLWALLNLIDTLRALRLVRANGRRVGVATRRRLIRQCLVCWVVFVVAQPLNQLADTLIGWIPLFSAIKTILLVVMFTWRPETSVIAYQHILVPVIRRYEPHIDLTLELVAAIISVVFHFLLHLPWHSLRTFFARVWGREGSGGPHDGAPSEAPDTDPADASDAPIELPALPSPQRLLVESKRQLFEGKADDVPLARGNGSTRSKHPQSLRVGGPRAMPGKAGQASGSRTASVHDGGPASNVTNKRIPSLSRPASQAQLRPGPSTGTVSRQTSHGSARGTAAAPRTVRTASHQTAARSTTTIDSVTAALASLPSAPTHLPDAQGQSQPPEDLPSAGTSTAAAVRKSIQPTRHSGTGASFPSSKPALSEPADRKRTRPAGETGDQQPKRAAKAGTTRAAPSTKRKGTTATRTSSKASATTTTTATRRARDKPPAEEPEGEGKERAGAKRARPASKASSDTEPVSKRTRMTRSSTRKTKE